MRRLLFSARLCVLDTETTGLPHADWSRVVELAGIVLDCDGSEVATWSSLVCPDILDGRAAEAFGINKLSVGVIRNSGIATEVAVVGFQAFLEEHGCRFVTSYNVRFDRAMVERMGLSLQWASCVMLRAQAHIRGLGAPYPGGSLARVSEHLGIPFRGTAHRALTDARVAAEIAITIRRAELAKGVA